jgi:hypothetical protein
MASGAFTASRRAIAALAVGGALAFAAGAAQPATPDARAAIGGRVIDAATGAPIEGAVVSATWWVELPPNPAAIVLGLVVGGHRGSDQRVAYVSEALTDREGRFSIPAWSAKQQWRIGSLTLASPVIRFLARDYSPTATTLGMWTSGSSHGEEIGEIGLRGPQVMALYRPGKKPKPDPGFRTSGLKIPTPAEERLEELRGFMALLDADARFSYSLESAVSSATGERVRFAQRHARRVLGEELRRVQGGKEKP